jgi:hypothetical protein
MWIDGKFISGQWTHRNGDIYEGSFTKNRPEGPGKYMFAGNKTTVHGKFADTRWTKAIWVCTPALILEPVLAIGRKSPPLIFSPVINRSNQTPFAIRMRFT